MHLLDSTRQHQSGLAAYCRTGNLPAIPGIMQENITQYRRLVYNIVDDMLESAYPLTYELLTTKEWKTVVNEFFRDHPCQSPQVWYMPKEFYRYLADTRHPLLEKYPFLEELLLFEWVELELFMMEDKKANYTSSGDVLFSRLVINPEHRLLSFQYPVHRKNARHIRTTDKANYFVTGHRNSEGVIKFTDLSPALARMIEYLAATPLSLIELSEALQAEYNIQLNDTDLQAIIGFFEKACQDQLIIGFKN